MKKMTKDEVAKISPNDVHEVLGTVMLADGMDLVLDLERSQGQILYDAKANRPYLDFFSYFASNPIGHNHPKMRDPKFIEEMGKIAIHNPSNSDLYTVEMAKFVATFHRVAMPDNMKHLFFVAGGGLAVENALKAAMDWKVRKNLAKGIGTECDPIGTRVVHMKNAFHGRTGYTLTITNTADPRKYMFFATFDWPRVTPPSAKFPLEGKNLEETIELERNALAELENAFKSDKDGICAFIMEPIQGEGGDNHFRKEYFEAVRELCDKYDIMLIFDEVQTGFGLTGKFWAWEHYGVEPDIIIFGKKAQVCGIIAGPRIDEVERNVFVESSRINSTWGGNLTDMARCRKYLEIIEEENLVENAAKMGAILMEGLQALQSKFTQISNTRGEGLMCAFDLPDGACRDKFLSACMDKGMILLPCGTHSVRFRPSLNVGKTDIERAIALIEEVLNSLQKSASCCCGG
ncbi:MAG TPA: L-lysine 6-transaminase [candidate division Zixibacteria bacterium]|nr:L-lysine 6-transaminase [candidate division Zixibacteria bacterium]